MRAGVAQSTEMLTGVWRQHDSTSGDNRTGDLETTPRDQPIGHGCLPEHLANSVACPHVALAHHLPCGKVTGHSPN